MSPEKLKYFVAAFSIGICFACQAVALNIRHPSATAGAAAHFENWLRDWQARLRRSYEIPITR
jgi:hypothetical protein